MTTAERREVWARGDAYEPYVGRWSRLVGREFVDWLARPRHLHWLDVRCGTGALSQIILEHCSPGQVAWVSSRLARTYVFKGLARFSRSLAAAKSARGSSWGSSTGKNAADAGVQLRRLAALLDGQDALILRLRAALEGQGETVRRLLMSVLPVVEAVVRKQRLRTRDSEVKKSPEQSGTREQCLAKMSVSNPR